LDRAGAPVNPTAPAAIVTLTAAIAASRRDTFIA
jgi:hypothetical protein